MTTQLIATSAQRPRGPLLEQVDRAAARADAAAVVGARARLNPPLSSAHVHALFGLSKDPFSIAPDPRFLYMSERHREALAHLLYGVQGGGGLRAADRGGRRRQDHRLPRFVDQLPKSVDVAYVFNPKLSVPELLATVCDDFGLQVPAGATVKAHVDALNAFLLEQPRRGPPQRARSSTRRRTCRPTCSSSCAC